MNKKNRLPPFLGLLAIILLLYLLVPRPESQEQQRPPGSVASTRPNQASLRGRPLPAGLHSVDLTNGADHPAIPTLVPKPMKLARKELVRKEWNSSPEAFHRSKELEGGSDGPAAVAYVKDRIYVLDRVGERMLSYDKDGKMLSEVALPTASGQDLVVNPKDSSLIMVDQLHNKIYKVDGNEVSLLGTAELNPKYPFGMKFDWNPETEELMVQDPLLTPGSADLQDGQIMVSLKGGQQVALAFDKPAFFAYGIVDARGNTWVLFNLEGDYRVDRLARIDAEGRVAGMAEIDVFHTFDTTRRIVATENGVVVLGGDEKEGRLLTFDYAGMVENGP